MFLDGDKGKNSFFVLVVFGFIVFFSSQHWGDECSLECKLENQTIDQDMGTGSYFY